MLELIENGRHIRRIIYFAISAVLIYALLASPVIIALVSKL